MESLRSRATLPWFGLFAALVGCSVMRSFSQAGQGRDDLGGGGLGGRDAGRDAQALVRRAAHREPRRGGHRGADVADPVEMADGVLRQRTTPPLHLLVD